MVRQRAKKEIMHRITVNYDAWERRSRRERKSDNIVRVLQKIERHKEQFLVPVLVSIQSCKEEYLQPDYTFFFKKISGIFNKY